MSHSSSIKPLVFLSAGLLMLTPCSGAEIPKVPTLAPYNVVWDSQSKDSTESMPLAGGNLGLNVWVENNDLLFLIGSPNCMDERGMQVKLGLVRLRFDQPVFAKDFRQELRLQESEIIVSGSSPSGGKVKATLWCEVNRPVIHVGIESAEPRPQRRSLRALANPVPPRWIGGNNSGTAAISPSPRTPKWIVLRICRG